MKKILISSLFLIGATSNAFTLKYFNQKSICGPTDDRVFSYDPKIGRAQAEATDKAGCSITMIGKTCAISAGHCEPVLKMVEFNPKHPDSMGTGGHATPEDIYRVDQRSITHVYNYGEDWAVFQLKPHAVSGDLAGEVYGTYPVSFKKPKKGAEVIITGYGIDRVNHERYGTQQTHSGLITKVSTFSDELKYRVDTEPGNSGSSVILESTGEIVAIHTNGGCSDYSNSTSNRGTLISSNKDLQKAIKSCLNSDL